MQLKKIILKGFKSFPEKTTLKFNEGVTAIVGPNGSGKSNIIEAIRWVMGEQSAKNLRGDRMNDVIFSGTNKRKPLNRAEVELILDNSDGYLDIEFEEVSILRRISRSGESTYMINQQECRLRDIVNLFMDSGLGKESFSIISQGKVEAIFNSKPEERRGIFEEAAGVYKYKVRKEDAEKKLDQTQENLDRVQDILYELETQLEPLKKQADIARSYLEQKEKLNDLDVGVTVWEIQNLTKKLEENTAQKNQIAKESAEMEQLIDNLEKKQAAQKENIATLEKSREKTNEQLVDQVREKERTEAALSLFDEKARHRQAFISEKETAIQRLNERKVSLRQELEQATAAYEKQNEELQNILQKIETVEKKRAYLEGDKEAQMEELRNDYIELLQQQTSLRNERSYLEQELKRSEQEKKKAAEARAKLEETVENQKKLLGNENTAYATISEELVSLLDTYKTKEQKLAAHKEELSRQSHHVNNTANELERAKAKYSSLKEMQENYAGYYAGVRAVMQQKNNLKGIIGTVAELVKIPEEYVQAIDTVLGSSGQFVVVEDEKSAREAIRYLKETKKGRATFLPLTTIKPRKITDQTKKQINQTAGFVGIASELVMNDLDVQNIIDNLLGQTIVAETLEAANKIARLIQFRNRVVSLAGDVINAGGSMTGGGGRQNNTNPIFTQKTELAALEQFIAEKEKVIGQLIGHQNHLAKEMEKTEQEVEEIRLLGEDKRLKEQQLQSEVTQLTASVNQLERQLKAAAFEKKESAHIYESFVQQLDKAEYALKTVTTKVQETNEEMQLLTSEHQNIEEAKEKLNQQIAEIHEQRNTAREALATARISRQHLLEQLTQTEQQIADLQGDIQSFDEEVEAGSKEELEQVLEKCLQKQSLLQEKQQEIRQNLEEAQKLSDQLHEQLKEYTGRNRYLSEQKTKLDIQLSRNDVRLDYFLEYLVEEYKISFEEARLLKRPEMTLEEAKKQVKLLKKGIDELGPVNLNAIEEHQTIDERYRFLTKQQNDLIEAKANLHHTMNEMDAIVEKQFKETFEQIQKEFADVFPKMFGGGNAELVLSDPDNLLETGVEIIAQPPGKRLTRLSLLSGGERALTAISLLFSIIHVNPIPFCILDEAEAALDDANVVRFGRYLENFEKETQFIVITHRKGTMEHSNQLYGVTMQERGISKIVSVNLNEARQMDGVT